MFVLPADDTTAPSAANGSTAGRVGKPAESIRNAQLSSAWGVWRTRWRLLVGSCLDTRVWVLKDNNHYISSMHVLHKECFRNLNVKPILLIVTVHHTCSDFILSSLSTEKNRIFLCFARPTWVGALRCTTTAKTLQQKCLY